MNCYRAIRLFAFFATIAFAACSHQEDENFGYSDEILKIKANAGKLPTEAQWEYVARAGSITPFYFGTQENELTNYAYILDNSNGEIHVVGQKIPYVWGLYDMYGNVAEMTDDMSTDYIEEPYPTFTTEDNPLIIDPINLSGSTVITRGGSYLSSNTSTNSYLRAFVYNHFTNYNVGFRVVFEK